MIEIIPAIIPSSFEDLKNKLLKVKGLVKTVQIDVLDGKFVSAVSWPYKKEDGEVFKIISEKIKLPFLQEIDFEIDMMVADPMDKIDDWVSVGAKRIVVHFESVADFSNVIKNFKERYKNENSPSVVELGMAFNIDTSNEKIIPFIYEVDFVQFMGIKKIGFQKQNFNKKVIEKIKSLRKEHPKVIITVDGGVNFETAKLLVVAGVNRLISGSFLFKNADIDGLIKKMEKLGE